MKTIVLEPMPKLFWEILKEKNLEKYFYQDEEKINSSEINIAIIRTKIQFNLNLFEKYPNLKLIIRAGSGFDNIDVKTALSKNIAVCNTPMANLNSAYEKTLSYIFAMTKNLFIHKTAVLSGKWKNDLKTDWEIKDLKALVVGCGKIGSKVAQTLKFLGAKVKGVDPYLSKEEKDNLNIDFTIYEEGISWCNLLTFHTPLTKETKHYFSKQTLEKLSNPIFLLNLSRGEVVDENILPIAIKNKKIMAFALDVFAQEPCKVKDFFKDEIAYLSPHSGAYTENAKNRLCEETIKVWEEFVYRQKVLYPVDERFIN